MAKLGFANITSLLFSFLAISNIIYQKQSVYDQLTSRNNWNAHYDYVVIGAGTAGSVLAARLTEDPSITVLLLEAGTSETVTSNTPGLSETLIGTVMDWKIRTIPQNHSCFGMNEQRCHLSAGRVIGGTSSINRMYYLRGNPVDFDRWETRYGLKSWAWKDVFPYMIRNEHQKDPDRAKTGYYGLNGPVILQRTRLSAENDPESGPDDRIFESFLSAGRLSGYRTMDLNVGSTEAAAMLQSTIHQGKRLSMATAFLEPNHKKRSNNLHILANAVAVKILFENDRAIGVKFYRDWQQYSVFARQEIIVSAGTLNTPKLLMLSGLGPRAELVRHGIPVVADLPAIGENLHDHVSTLGMYFVANQLPEPGITKQHLKQYFYYGKGPLAENRYAGAVFRLPPPPPPSSSSPGRWSQDSSPPDLMLLTYVNSLTTRDLSPEFTEQQTNLKRSVWNAYYGPKMRNKNGNGKLQFTILPVVLRPKSRGTVRLRSANPFDAAEVDPAYLRDRQDLDRLVVAMREALQLTQMPPFQQFGTEWYRSMVPGCQPSSQSSVQLPPYDTYEPPTPEIIPETTATTTTTTETSTTKRKPSAGSSATIGRPIIKGTNVPFHFVSSLMERLFRKSSKTDSSSLSKIKKNKRMLEPGRVKQASSGYFYDHQYWVDDNGMIFHPLMNKTIYGGLVDGFSSSSGPEEAGDQSGIIETVFNSHSDPKRSKSTTTTTTTEIPELPPGVSPIVLTGYFSSRPKPEHLPPDRPTTSTTTATSSSSNVWRFNRPATTTTTTTTIVPETIPPPPPERQPNEPQRSYEYSDEYLRCVAQTLTMPMGDYVGTCRMGDRRHGHTMAVVDERFRVLGVRSLRVVDNSVIPEIPTGSLMAVAIMLGERGAEFIRDDRIHHSTTSS